VFAKYIFYVIFM